MSGSWRAFLSSQEQIQHAACSHEPLVMDQLPHKETCLVRIKTAIEWDRKATKGLCCLLNASRK